MIGGIVFLIIILANAVRILREYERGVVFRLGRFIGGKGPGLIILWPFIDKMVKVSLRTVVMDVPPQDIITKDNVSLKVNAVIYFRFDSRDISTSKEKSCRSIQTFFSRSFLGSVLGQSE